MFLVFLPEARTIMDTHVDAFNNLMRHPSSILGISNQESQWLKTLRRGPVNYLVNLTTL